MLESLSLQVLHGEERRTIVLSDFINHTDAGMIQRGCGSRLALKALQRLRIAGQFLRQKLHRGMAAQLGVPVPVQHAHSRPAQLWPDLLMWHGLIGQSSVRLLWGPTLH